MKLSAVICVRNEIECLPMCVDTIIKDVDELILVDNRSDDGSLEWMKDLQSKSPKQVKLVETGTIFDEATEWKTRNLSLSHVTGDWVMLIDADQLMSDGWWKWTRGPMNDKAFDGIRVKYEHWVGSYEYIHKSFMAEQKNPGSQQGVPLWQGMLYRMRPDLKVKAVADEYPQFREQHHASADFSMKGRRFYDCGSATVFHLGFCKRNMMFMAKYRIQRGDYGHEQAKKDEMIAELDKCGNPFKFIGDVCRVEYGKERVPSIIRDKFGKTYKLELDKDGFIQSRTHIPTGERC